MSSVESTRLASPATRLSNGIGRPARLRLRAAPRRAAPLGVPAGDPLDFRVAFRLLSFPLRSSRASPQRFTRLVSRRVPSAVCRHRCRLRVASQQSSRSNQCFQSGRVGGGGGEADGEAVFEAAGRERLVSAGGAARHRLTAAPWRAVSALRLHIPARR